jgi:hypothetical protein
VALLIGWLAWYLRDELKKAASRIVKVGVWGAEVALESTVPQQRPTRPGEALPEIKGTLAATEKPDTLSFEGEVKADDASVQAFIADIGSKISEDQLARAVQVTRHDLAAKFGSDARKQAEVLIWMNAALSVALGHERNYNVIFGSQLRLLGQMIPQMGVPASFARAVYEEAKAAFPELYRTITFEQPICQRARF